MRIWPLSLMVLTALLSLCPATVHATPIIYTAILNGASESPATGSPGTGTATVIIGDVLDTMEVEVSFSGLGGATTSSHLNCCVPIGGNAGVATTMPTFPGFPLGATSGSYDQVFDLSMASTYNPAFVAANGGTVDSAETVLLAGLAADEAYLNINSTVDPAGEIRGFLQPAATAAVPEPATLLLFGTGLSAVARRRFKRHA
jgi:hypothetical protein